MSKEIDIIMVPLKGREAELMRDMMQIRCDFIVRDVESLKKVFDNVVFLVPQKKETLAELREKAKRYEKGLEAKYGERKKRR